MRPLERKVINKSSFASKCRRTKGILRKVAVRGKTDFIDTDKEKLQRFEYIEFLCKYFDRGRGIWKQIDENRQIIECLVRDLPETLQKAPWLEGWLHDNDIFLNTLLELIDIRPDHPSPYFPRRWMGKGNYGNPDFIAHEQAEAIRKQVHCNIQDKSETIIGRQGVVALA